MIHAYSYQGTGLEPITAIKRQETGYTLDKSAAGLAQRGSQLNLKSLINLTH